MGFLRDARIRDYGYGGEDADYYDYYEELDYCKP
jgi:hypothetical protein